MVGFRSEIACWLNFGTQSSIGVVTKTVKSKTKQKRNEKEKEKSGTNYEKH
jgi:hypothetical protein